MVEVERGHMGSRCLCCFCCAEHSSEAAPTSLVREKKKNRPSPLTPATLSGLCGSYAQVIAIAKTSVLGSRAWPRRLC